MEKRRLWASLIVTAFTLLVLCATLTVSTYAWFTFDPYTNVTPMEGNISDGDTNLLISESKTGPFEKKCELNPDVLPDILQPVSTYDLTAFFASVGQNREGISTNFKDVTDTAEDRFIQGTVYLQCLGAGCDVYFNEDTLDLGDDNQILAAGRLGLKITGEDEKTITLIFKLDDLGLSTGVEKRRTVGVDGDVVIESVSTSGAPNFEDDPALSIGDYMIDATNAKKLCTLQADEIAKVDYWLYLEGCDDECSNPVQKRDVTLMLSFAGKRAAEQE